MKEFDSALNCAYLYWGPNLLLVYHDNLLIITKTKDWEHSLRFLVTQPFKEAPGVPSRWQRNKTWRSPSSPQIHQNYIYMWNNSYRTPTERWQKTSDFPKRRPQATYTQRRDQIQS